MAYKSRYAGVQPTKDKDGATLLLGRPRVIKKDFRDNQVHIAVEGEDCTLLAWMYLENERYWWVIADMNNIADALEPFKGGERVTIPSVRTLHQEIIPAVTG